MNIWNELRQAISDRNERAIETSLLGRSLPIKLPNGKITGYIPINLQKEAKKHGLFIEAALWKDGFYQVGLNKL